MIAGKEDVGETLAWMHRERHQHLYQYIATVCHRGGMTQREAAQYMGVSHQRVYQLKRKGLDQIAMGEKIDLSAWPLIETQAPSTRQPLDVPPRMRGRLRRMNAVAKDYRSGESARAALRFYNTVRELHHTGVSYNAIARALGEPEKGFLRRLSRWGVTTSRSDAAKVVAPARRGRV